MFVRAQACTKPPTLPIRESKDLDVLGNLENFTIASTRIPPPPSGKLKIWMDVLGDLENYTIASIRT